MKLFIKVVIFLVLLAFVGPYLLMGPEGQMKMQKITNMVMDRMDFSLPSTDDITPGVISEKAAPTLEWSKKDTFESPSQLTKEQLAVLDVKAQQNIYYRWQDKDGVWQFSSLPNRNTLNMVVKTDPNANLLQGMSDEQVDIALGRFVPETDNSITENNPMANGEGLENEIPLPITVPIAEIPKLIDQAKDVQKLMDQRVQNMDKMLNNDL